MQPLQRLGGALVKVPILIHRLHEQVFEVVQRLIQDNARGGVLGQVGAA